MRHKQLSTKIEKGHRLANKRPYLTGFGPVLAVVALLITLSTAPPAAHASFLFGSPVEIIQPETFPAPVISLATDPNDQRAAYALLVTNVLYQTTDYGQSWQRLPLPAQEQPFQPAPERPNEVPITPQQDVVMTTVAPGRLFVRAGQTLYRSDDRGQTWQALLSPVSAWTVNSSEGDFLYAWRVDYTHRDRHGLYFSQDGGNTWQQVYRGFFPPQMKDDEVAPNHEGVTSLAATFPDLVYAGTDFGLFRSLNGGRSWQEFNPGLPATERTYRWTPIVSSGYPNTYALTEFSPTQTGEQSQAVLARLKPGEIRYDQDTWTVASDRLGSTESTAPGFYGLHTLVMDPTNSEVSEKLYLGTEQGLLMSADAGQTWQPLDLPEVGAVYRLAIAPGPQPLFYLWTDQGLVITPVSVSASIEPQLAAPELSLEIINQVGGQVRAVAVEDDIAYLGVGPRLVTLDLTNADSPQLIGQSEILPGLVQEVIVIDGMAYLAAGEAGLRILDTLNPSSLPEIGFFETTYAAQGLVVQNGLAYLATGWRDGATTAGALQVIDLANPAAPREISTLPLPAFANHVAVAGDYAYIAQASGLQIIEVSDPTAPRSVGQLDLSNLADITIRGKYAYLLGQDLRILDLSVPGQPIEVGAYTGVVLSGVALAAAGNNVYLATGMCEFGHCQATIQLIDVADPAAPQQLNAWEVPDRVADLAIAADRAYLAVRNGLQMIDLAGSNGSGKGGMFNILGSATHVAAIPAPSPTPPSGSTPVYAYVATEAEDGLHILDVTDPAKPQQIGLLSNLNSVKDLIGANPYLYIPTWPQGVHLLDVSDPANPQEITLPDETTLASSAQQVALAGKYAYLVTEEGRLEVLDLANPANPRSISQMTLPAQVRALAAANDHVYISAELVEAGEQGPALQVIDVTDPANPHQVGQLELPGQTGEMIAGGDKLYLTTANCYYNHCSGELLIFDVSDPAQPRQLSRLEIPGGGLDLSLVDDYAYVAAGEAGLWVVNISEAPSPRLVGWLDTPGWAGQVTVLNDYLYVADEQGGLFILRPVIK